MLFQCYIQRLFSIEEHIVVLEENTARNPEFEYNHFKVANMNNSK